MLTNADLFDQPLAAPLIAKIPPEQLNAVASAFVGGASREDRIGALEAALRAGGKAWRREIGRWTTRIIPVETLVPEANREWRPLVRDSIQFFFSQLSDRRLAAKLVEQVELPQETPPEARLIRLISKMPGLQKLGQVLARNRRLRPTLRHALTELENGMCDVTAEEIRAIIVDQLGHRLERYAVEIEPAILSEASVSAVIRFTWRQPDRERQHAVFKVLKPYVPHCFAEDMTLLQKLGRFLAAKERGYRFAVRDVNEMMTEVRMLLEHELDFTREQSSLGEAAHIYRATFGIRVPKVIPPLCTPRITAMSAENGVKVTEARSQSPVRRDRIAGQLIQALLAVPLFSREDPAIFHADPHAGNLLYDEPNRELVVLDWALAERLDLESRRQVVLLVLMMILRNPEGVRQAIQALSRGDKRVRTRDRLIRGHVDRFFTQLIPDQSAGALEAMMLLDEIALAGVRFPAPLFLFRKIVFTLDGVLHDIAGPEVRMDQVIAREFLTRWIASFGLFHAPLRSEDFLKLQWNALLYPARAWLKSVQDGPASVVGVSR
jgi:ubiquinone biosynthesis protein